MAVTPLKAVLFAGGGIVAAAAVAYVSGALDPYFKPQPPAEVAALNPPSDKSANPADVSPGTGVHEVTPPASDESAKPATEAAVPPGENAMKPAAPAAQTTPAKTLDQSAAPKAAAGPVLPTFDVVRVEGGGSLVVAGNAAPNAKVEILNGDAVIGSTTAGPDGAFAIVLDDPLKPGDYQLLLRSTTPDNVISHSQQTAVVSVPDKPGGQVLALVEEAGKASELMAVPSPAKQPDQSAASSQANTSETPPSETKTAPAAEPAKQPSPAAGAQDGNASPQTATAPAETKPAEATPAIAGAPRIAVEAVEIDGSKVFVAGTADPGRKVRAYANEILLGDATASPDGHFLIEATRDLPVGTYTVRVDALDADGAKVVARAAVPFEREPGTSMAAVAPAQSGAAAGQSSGAAAANPPAGTSAAPAETASKDQGTSVAGEAPSSGQASPAATSQPEQQPEVAAAQPSDGVPETVSPKLEHADGAVIIRRRDTLWQISRRVYGHGVRYSTIYLANQDQISDPDLIWPGQVFRVPGTSKEGESADMKALGDQATTPSAKTE